ncbi:MAG TPA: hypothetical protein VMU59_04790 [Caulobacteraceae bacterium]|nr:hypothetical protein [Caulobacteraceae bacterium]
MKRAGRQNIKDVLRSAAVLTVFGLTVPGLACAQAAKAPLPSADQVLAKYERFLGGAAALSKVSTRTIETRRLQSGARFSDTSLLRLSKRPLLSIMEQSALDGSFIHYGNGCDSKGGWIGSESSENSGRPADGPASTSGICQQELFYYGYLPLDLAALKANIGRLEVKGESRIIPESPGAAGALAGGRGGDLVPDGPRQAYLVLSSPLRPNDIYMWLYFDTETGALLRREEAGKGPAPTPPGLNTRHTDFVQYREVGDGTRAPFQFISIEPNTEVHGVEVRIVDNDPIGDDQFVRPNDVHRQDKGL